MKQAITTSPDNDKWENKIYEKQEFYKWVYITQIFTEYKIDSEKQIECATIMSQQALDYTQSGHSQRESKTENNKKKKQQQQ